LINLCPFYSLCVPECPQHDYVTSRTCSTTPRPPPNIEFLTSNFRHVLHPTSCNEIYRVCIAACHWPKNPSKTSDFYIIFNFKISKFLYLNAWTLSYTARPQRNVAQISSLIRLLASILTPVRPSVHSLNTHVLKTWGSKNLF
jgi:hypothetical protein